jgi:hypothetical protein
MHVTRDESDELMCWVSRSKAGLEPVLEESSLSEPARSTRLSVLATRSPLRPFCPSTCSWKTVWLRELRWFEAVLATALLRAPDSSSAATSAAEETACTSSPETWMRPFLSWTMRGSLAGVAAAPAAAEGFGHRSLSSSL